MLLSPQNPPLDPHEISQHQLNTSDERPSSSSSDSPSDSDKVALQEEVVEVIDLLNKSGGSDDNNPPHNFSIRGYVFGARIKDIETNWPFSRKSLQLCQKHGVKTLLPPFQSLSAVTIPCSSRRETETSNVETESVKISNEVVPSGLDDQLVSLASGNNSECGKNPPLGCVDIVPSKFEGDKKIQTAVKKCKLIIKVGGTDPSAARGDSMVNSAAAFAETSTAASKVCPVCKNFSSSSNTTLNAHIDQCLSMESPPSDDLNATNARVVIRHRVKPRKTKLMVEIYKTAPHCTLEELDLRNGSSWAVNSNMPFQEPESAAEDDEQNEDVDEEDADEDDEFEPRVSSVNFSGEGDESEVYIDANGTKVRILSKFNDVTPSVPKLKEGHGHLKLGKGNGRKKFMSTSMKKHHIKKRHKYLNLTLDARSKRFSSPMSQHTFEVDEVQERNVSPAENSWKEQSVVQEETKSDDSGTITKWASSKRRVLLRKRSCKEGLLHLASNFRQDLSTGSDRSCFTNPAKNTNCVPRTPNSNKHPLASPNRGKRLEDPTAANFSMNEFSDQSSVRKRVGGNMEKFLEPPTKKQLRKEGRCSLGGSFKDLTTNIGNRVPSFACDPPETSTNRDKHVPSSKASKFSSPRKHISLNQKTSLLESTKKAGKSSSSGKKSEEVDDTLCSDTVLEQDPLKKTGKMCIGKRSALEFRKKRRSFGLASPSDGRNRNDSALSGGGGTADSSSDMECDREGEDNAASGPSSGVDVVGNVAIHKSYDTDFHKMTSPSNTTSGSLRSLCGTETATTLCAINRSFHDDQMFGEDEDEEVGVEMDSREVQKDFFTIPIPGPPGSFLPSPRNMGGSEVVQGNSSLTMSMPQSSEDHHNLIDGDSSGSPVSAKSAISNSKYAESSSAGYHRETRPGFPGTAKPAISNSKYAENSSAGYHQGEIRPGLPSTAKSVKPLEETSTNVDFPERMPASFRNDQPCCCSRKEAISQNGFLNFQESQLLKRRTMASSVQVPTNRSSTLPEGFSSGSFLEKNAAAKAWTDSAPKSASGGGSDSACPSGSNPVLRLMGKNLMVVNRAENFTDQPSQTTPPVFPGTTIQNHHYNNTTFANHFIPPRPPPQTSAHVPSGINNFAGAGFEQHEYGHQPMKYRNFQTYPLAHNNNNAEKAAKTSDIRRQQWNIMNHHPMKEIIIIDDEPETEANRGGVSGNGRSIAAGGGFSGAPTAGNNTPHSCYVSPFYSFGPRDSPPYFHQVPPQSRAGGSPNKWIRYPGGSHDSPPPPQLPPPLPPPSSRLRPPMYYTPNFS